MDGNDETKIYGPFMLTEAGTWEKNLLWYAANIFAATSRNWGDKKPNYFPARGTPSHFVRIVLDYLNEQLGG